MVRLEDAPSLRDLLPSNVDRKCDIPKVTDMRYELFVLVRIRSLYIQNIFFDCFASEERVHSY